MKVKIATLFYLKCSWLLLATRQGNHISGEPILEAVILRDMFPTDDEDSLCHSNYQNFHFQYSTNRWDLERTEAEQQLFLAQLQHVDLNQNRSWTIRVGQGGNMYSLKGRFGEAISPNEVDDALWVDEVYQSVAVNTKLNKQEKGKHWYIHQAGTYQRDDGVSMDNPFFSPNIAKHCSRRGDQQCAFASWGQQAHIPTNFTSYILYFTRYRDCGNGVIETTNLIHNAADPSLSESPDIDWENVPWTSFRTETFEKMLVTDANKEKATQIFPMPIWGDDPPIKVKDTQGYMMMAQNLPNPSMRPLYKYSMPCSDGEFMKDCSQLNGQKEILRLVVRDNNRAVGSLTHIRKYGKFVVKLPVEDTIKITDGLETCDLYFLNERTEKKIHVSAVMHWAWIGIEIYFHPTYNTVEEINQIFSKGDQIRVYHTTLKRFPCARNGYRFVDCPKTGYEDSILKFVIAKDKPCRESKVWTERNGKYTAELEVEPTHDVRQSCEECTYRFVNARNFEYFIVKGITAWSYKGKYFYFSPTRSCKFINSKFHKGDTLHIDYSDAGEGMSPEDSLALSVVYGTNPEINDPINNEWMQRPAQLRYGLTAKKVASVFTVLPGVVIKPGETYLNRQYLIVDRYEGMDKRASIWTKETYQDLYEQEELPSRLIRLFRRGLSFGAEFHNSCPNANLICLGRTTPQIGKKALYAIECGDTSYVGPDPYALAPKRKKKTDPIKSYECDGQPGLRPTWKLLGFFEPNHCRRLQNAVYDEDFSCRL